ncbi:FAD-dependent oxidoreductase [Paucibacter sp. JuS9]|uniref:FAD-dependent oxidoreductase n=1 Tax=Paucibacter sp. JuS9 TaxID=3228748 RepID=UPI003757D24C
MKRLQADVLVVGAGPAGMAAVRALLKAGRQVIWIDKQDRPGGQIWRGGPPPAWQHMTDLPGLTLLGSHVVIAADGPSALVLHDTAQDLALRAEAPQLLLATGARERMLPFPGWTLPGVTGAGGLQALVKGGWPVARKRVVLAGSGPLLLAAADTLKASGGQVLAVVEQARPVALAGFAARLPLGKVAQALNLRWRLRGTPYLHGAWVQKAYGDARLEGVSLSNGQQLACEALGIGFGLLPNTELAALLGCALRDGAISVDVQMQTSVKGIFAAGECTGIGGVEKSMLEGARAAQAMLGRTASRTRQHAQALAFGRALQSSFDLRPELLKLADARTLVCRCEDVNLGELKGCSSWRDAKLQTRCGMGACQGRVCGGIANELFGWRDAPGLPRAPLQPVPIHVLLQLDEGCGQSAP